MTLAQFRQLTVMMQTAVLAAIAERMFTEYVQFVRRELHGSAPTYRRVLDAIWKHLEGPTISEARARELLDWFRPYVDDADESRIEPSNDGWASSIALKAAIGSCMNAMTTHVERPIVHEFQRFIGHSVIDLIQATTNWNVSVVNELRDLIRSDNRPIDWNAWLADSDERNARRDEM